MSSLLTSSIAGFENFDRKDVVKRFEESVYQKESLNFALEFDDEKAFGALNLSLDSLTRLLPKKVNKSSLLTNTTYTLWVCKQV